MAMALELGSGQPESQLVLDAWKELGWNHKKAQGGIYSVDAAIVAENYISQFNWEIVAAEASLGKKGSRTRGKMVLFGIIYGGGAKAVMGLLYVNQAEAKQYIADVKKTYPQIKIYSDALMRQAISDGYIRTIFGRRINIDPDYAYRCVDYIVQGSAADMLKRAMIKNRELFRYPELRGHAYQLLPMHDEVIFEFREGYNTIPLLRQIQRNMEDMDGKLNVPMPVEFARFPSTWAKPVKVKL
jgi:DNA polymerase I-like protein with 3'-5' exonuclease and polymerase domains